MDVWWLRKSPPPLKLQNRQCSRRGSHGIRLPHLPRRIATHGASRALLRRRERRPRIDIPSDILTHNYRFELEIKCTFRRRHTPGPCTHAITDTWASTVLPLYIHIQHPRLTTTYRKNTTDPNTAKMQSTTDPRHLDRFRRYHISKFGYFSWYHRSTINYHHISSTSDEYHHTSNPNTTINPNTTTHRNVSRPADHHKSK